MSELKGTTKKVDSFVVKLEGIKWVVWINLEDLMNQVR